MNSPAAPRHAPTQDQKAALKRTSMMVVRCSEELTAEGPPPASQAPEALAELGNRVVRMLSDTKKLKLPAGGDMERVRTTIRLPPSFKGLK